MKKLLVVLVIILSVLDVFSQIKLNIQPMLEIGIENKNEGIRNSQGQIVRDEHGNLVMFTNPYTITYDINVGFRATLTDKLYIEAENKFFMFTESFDKNYPYSVEFYLRAVYKIRKVKINAEHMCKHYIDTNAMTTNYNVVGGHSRISVSYNIN